MHAIMVILRIIVAMSAISILIASMGCWSSGRTVIAGDIVGTWSSDSDVHSTLTFGPHGELVVDHFPDYQRHVSPPDAYVSGRGDWMFFNDKHETILIDVTGRNPHGAKSDWGQTLTISREDRVRLLLFIGDPDDGKAIAFVKKLPPAKI